MIVSRMSLFARMLAAGVLCAAGTLSGCGGSADSSAAKTDTLVYGRGGDANTLDPINTDIGEAVKVIVNVFETLVAYHEEELTLVPGLAVKWENSQDGREWTFHLREGVKFHDGTPCDADAVVFSLERLISDQHPAVYDPLRPYRPNFQMIEKVEAVDARTVKFHLKEASAVFLNNLAMFPASVVSPTAVQKLGKEFATAPVGTGPFKFGRWKRDQQIVLEANPDYWDGAPRIARVVFVPIADGSTRVAQLRKGAIHLAEDLPPTELDAVAKEPGIAIQACESLNVGYLTLQTERPPLDKLKVRQAIAHAIDKQEMAHVVFADRAHPAVTLVPRNMWGYADQLADRKFDPATAKKLLEEAVQEEKLELPLKLTLAVMNQPRPYMQQPLQAASFVKDALGKIGIEVTVEPRPISQHFEHLMAGGHQMGLAGWTTDNSDPDNFLYSLLDVDNISEHGNNLSRYRNDEVHRLLLGAQKELDADKRLAMYARVQELCLQDAPVVPLISTEVRIAQTARLKGYRLHPASLVRLRRAYFESATPGGGSRP